MKKFLKFLPVVALLAGVFGVAATKSDTIGADAAITTSPGYTDGIDQDRTRIWLDRGHYGTTDATVIIRIDGTYEFQPSGYEQALQSGLWYAYYDVEISMITGKEIRFLKVQSDEPNAIWNTSTPLTYTTGDSSYLFKLPTTDDSTNLLKKTSVTGRIVNNFFAKVLEGYLTCSSNIDNGYEAFNNIDTNFLPRTSDDFWDMEGNLGDVTITDYAGVGTTPYENPRGTGQATNAYVKYSWMQSLYNSAHPVSGERNIDTNSTNNVTLITLVGTLSLSALAGFYFLKTKKH